MKQLSKKALVITPLDEILESIHHLIKQVGITPTQDEINDWIIDLFEYLVRSNWMNNYPVSAHPIAEQIGEALLHASGILSQFETLYGHIPQLIESYQVSGGEYLIRTVKFTIHGGYLKGLVWFTPPPGDYIQPLMQGIAQAIEQGLQIPVGFLEIYNTYRTHPVFDFDPDEVTLSD